MTPEEKQVLFTREGKRKMLPFVRCLEMLLDCGDDPQVTAFWLAASKKATTLFNMGEQIISVALTPPKQEPKQPEPEEEPPTAPASTNNQEEEAATALDEVYFQLGLDRNSLLVAPTE